MALAGQDLTGTDQAKQKGAELMADGKWVMTAEDSKRVDLTFGGGAGKGPRDLPNYGKHIYVDDRGGGAARRCAFCGSEEVEAGFGTYGRGFACRSYLCGVCGGTTDLVYQDTVGKYFGTPETE